jgi:hypothetical protein
MLTCQLTGDEALAGGAWESGVCLATAFRECLESNALSVLLISGPCPNLTEKIC